MHSKDQNWLTIFPLGQIKRCVNMKMSSTQEMNAGLLIPNQCIENSFKGQKTSRPGYYCFLKFPPSAQLLKVWTWSACVTRSGFLSIVVKLSNPRWTELLVRSAPTSVVATFTATCSSNTMKIRVNHNPCAWTCLTFFSLFKSAKATLKAVDGCDHSSECVATYWRTIWILILVVSLLYLISVAWTFWISSKW